MSSQARRREEERRLSLTTLAIASIASALAAVVTSQFWVRGTPLAAALTPVIVAVTSELLRRPTERITERLSSTTSVILPDAAGAAPPARPAEHPLPDRAPAEPGSGPPIAPAPGAESSPRQPSGEGPVEGPVRVYRQRPARRRRIAVGVVAATAVLAFAIAAAALTLPELIAGKSVVKGNRQTTFFGGHRKRTHKQSPTTQTTTQPEGGAATQPKEGTTTTTTPKGSTAPGSPSGKQQTGPTTTGPTTGPSPPPKTPGQ
jgi:hypothetical protein